MFSDPSRRPHDMSRVDIDAEHDVKCWMRTFRCSEDELRAAVAAVGGSAARVRDYLQPESAF